VAFEVFFGYNSRDVFRCSFALQAASLSRHSPQVCGSLHGLKH
jgi:hypothetical protein